MDTPPGLTSTEAKRRLALDGPNEVLPAPVHPLRRFLARFWGLSAWLLELIAGLSLVLHKMADLGVALALLVVNAILGQVQEQRAAAAVDTLRRRMQVTARVLRDGQWARVPARDLVKGDVVRVRAGDLAPADLRVAEGALSVDESALTGESRDIAKRPGEVVHAGSMVRGGEATGEVVAVGAATSFGRTTELVDGARPRLHVEAVVSRVVRWMFAIVGAEVAIVVALALLRHGAWSEILPLSLVLLMAAVPVALPVMLTVSMSLGAMELGRQGVLVTRLGAAEDAANMDVLCADKTGTLTMDRVAWAGGRPEAGFTEDALLRLAAMASSEADQDAIDLAILGAARDAGPPSWTRRSFVPFTAQTRRTEAVVEDGGSTLRVVKGAVRTVAGLAGLDATAQAALMSRAEEEARRGHRVLAVARARDDGPLELVGLALLADPLRPDSRRLVRALRDLGVGVRMVTGDAAPVAAEVARQLDLSEVDAEVLPEGKLAIVRSLQARGHVVGMTGDGVNDAPALRQAEVGIAVSGATDVAKGAASVVLTREGLVDMVDLVRTGRSIYQRVLTWIVNKVSSTLLKSGFVAAAFVATGRFVISALGMVLLLFMTDFVKIALATDRVRPSPRPVTWNIGPLVRVGAFLGVLMLAEALMLLAFGWKRYALDVDAGRRATFAFETLLFFSLFSIVSIRERGWFWESRPSTALVAAFVADGAAGLALGLHGLGDLRPLALPPLGLVVAVSAVATLLVNDAIKRWLSGAPPRPPRA